MKALVFIETKDGAPVGGSLELFGAAASIGAEAEGIVIGDEAAAKAAADAVGASVSFVAVYLILSFLPFLMTVSLLILWTCMLYAETGVSEAEKALTG